MQTTVKMATAEKHFHVPSEEETDKDSINTQKATQLSVKCFRDYLREQDPDNVEFEEFLILFVFVLCLVCPILSMYLDCQFLIVPSGFSNVYLHLFYLLIILRKKRKG